MTLMLTFPTVVAIPARNEGERIAACLQALVEQTAPTGRPLWPSPDVAILVLANNCIDDTASIARTFAAEAPVAIHVHEAHLSKRLAHAGGARRSAMEAAAALLERSPDAEARSLIATTDADSRPARDWLTRTWRAIDAGADAVAGVVAFDPTERTAPVSGWRRLEARYSALQAEVIARIDPDPHDPWPNHLWSWGASLAVKLSAYRAVGGVPIVPLAEDRALAERLVQGDFRLRHALDVRVLTSSRCEGRAPGGLAQLIDRYGRDDDFPCDAALRPILDAAALAGRRARLRTLKARGRATPADARALGVSPFHLRAALAVPGLGSGFAALERVRRTGSCPRLTPKALPLEIHRAERLLHRLNAGGTTDPADSALAASAGLWSG